MTERENMTKKTRGLLLVQMDIDPEHEDELNAWYEQEHLPERAELTGFLSARRFEAVDGAPKYLALYDLEDVGVLDGPEYQALMVELSPRTKSISRMLNTMVRKVYREIPRSDGE